MTGPSVAIVIPCFNAVAWIDRAVTSALAQTHTPVTVHVVDDGSTDDSTATLAAFGDAISWETAPNHGAPAARNRGLERIDSAYVMFLDADDYLSSDAVDGLARAAKDTGADVAFGPWRRAWPDRREQRGDRTVLSAQSTDDLLSAWLSGDYVPPCSVLWRTAFLRELGGWDAHLPRNQDGELVLRALTHGARWAIAKTGYGVYVDHDDARRISRGRSPAVLAAQTDVLARVRGWLGDDAAPRVQAALATAHYSLAREAYRVGANDVGDRALAEAQRLGLRTHPGTRYHRIAASLLGLRRKEQLRASVLASVQRVTRPPRSERLDR